MHKYTALGFLGVGLMVSPLLTHLAGSAVPVSPKIGAIDMQRTFQDSGAGKRANAAFVAKQQQKQTEIKQKEKDFNDAQAALEKQKTMLKQDVYDGKKQDLYKQYLELQKAAAKADQELALEEQKTLDALLTQAE